MMIVFLRNNNQNILATKIELNSIYFIPQKVFFECVYCNFESDLMKLKVIEYSDAKGS